MTSPAWQAWRGLLLAAALYGAMLSAPLAASLAAPFEAPSDALRATLRELSEQASTYGTVASQAQARVGAAAFDLDEARGRRWPRFEASVQSSLHDNNAGREGSRRPRPSVSATYTLLDWGRTEALVTSGEHGLASSRHQYDAVIAGLSYDACVGFMNLAHQHQLHALGRDYVQRMETLVSALARIVEADRGRASELVQARARQAQAQAVREQAEMRVHDAAIALQRLTGRRAVPDLVDGPWQMGVPALEGLLAALPVHPLVRQAEADAQASRANVDALSAGLWPQLNLSVGRTLGGHAPPRTGGWQVNLSASMVLGQDSITRNAVGAANERARANVLRRDQVLLDQEFMVRAAHQAAWAALARAGTLDGVSAELAQVRDVFMQQWLRMGRRSLLDVLNAQTDHYANEASALASRFDAWQAILKAYANAGQLIPWLRGELVAQ